MPNEPEIKLMSYSKRQNFFLVLLLVFAVMLPAMIFYTTGYRINFNDAENRIVTTGGMYITTDNLEVDVYLDDEQVRRPRLFRSAYYIQDIASGVHRVVVQQDGLNTWVKELPVDPYIVIEAAAFNMPVTPQVRYITPFTTLENLPVIPLSASTSDVFVIATSSQTFIVATTTATSSFVSNTEYELVKGFFSTSTATSTSVFDRLLEEVERFGFATSSANGATTTLTELITKGNISLVERSGELYATWTGSDSSIPYYFCVTNLPLEEISERYGEHVAKQIEEQSISTTTPMYTDENRICRREIQIDRKRQDVYFYDFVPGSSDLVLLQLENGLYVSEIDDRSWQNTQMIFPGTGFRVSVENDRIFVKEGELFFELLTKIPQ